MVCQQFNQLKIKNISIMKLILLLIKFLWKLLRKVNLFINKIMFIKIWTQIKINFSRFLARKIFKIYPKNNLNNKISFRVKFNNFLFKKIINKYQSWDLLVKTIIWIFKKLLNFVKKIFKIVRKLSLSNLSFMIN